MFMYLQILIAAVALFLVSYLSIPKFMGLLSQIGLKGKDVHKLDRPDVIESGGTVLLLFLPLFLLFLYSLTLEIKVLHLLVVAVPFGIFGFVDDLKVLSKYKKLLGSALIALLGSFLFVAPSFNFPIFLLAAFLLIVGSNIFNWLGGLNGLEVGTSIIITAFMALNLFLLGRLVPFYLALGLLLVLLGLFKYNKYPASIFPGDSGTLFIGAYLTSFALFFDLWNIYLPLLSLHLLNAFLKFFSAGLFSYSEKKPTRIEEDGKLAPRSDFLSVIRLLLHFKRMEEEKVVKLIWVLTLIVGIITTVLVQSGAG